MCAQFATFVNSLALKREPLKLPFVHTTEARNLESIATHGQLATKFCAVASRPVIYLFYGRPAYRSNQGSLPTTDNFLFPICFVFRHTFIEQRISAIFPFDTGAASSGMFQPIIQGHQTGDYQLPSDLLNACRMVNFFFGSNGKYFQGIAKRRLSIPSNEEEALKYYKLITHKDSVRYDDRRSAIEILLDNALPIKESIETVFLPRVLMSKLDIKHLVLNGWGCTPKLYNSAWGGVPNESSGAIRELLEARLGEGGIL